MRLFFHNITTPQFAYHIDAYDFDQQALFLAERNDVVVLRRQPQPEWMNYMVSIGTVPSSITTLHPGTNTDSPTEIFYDKFLRKSVRRVVEGSRTATSLHTYQISEHEVAWAKAVGVRFETRYPYEEDFSSKLVFKKIVQELGLLTPKYIALNSHHYFSRLMALGWVKYTKPDSLIIKLNKAARGFGSRHWHVGQGYNALFTLHQASPEATLLEHWIDSGGYSPSVQLWVHVNGVIELQSLHEQLLGPDKITYIGCRPLCIETSLLNKLTSEAYLIGQNFAKRGYVGPLGLDAIVAKDRIWWLEANPRFTLAMYTHSLYQKIHRQLSRPAYYQSICFCSSRLKKMTVQQFLHRCRNLLYQPGKTEGIIPYELSLLSLRGQVTVLCIAEEVHGANKLLRSLEELIGVSTDSATTT